MRFINPPEALSTLIACALPSYSFADMRGVNAAEIRIGQTMPYSGPVWAFGALGKGRSAISR